MREFRKIFPLRGAEIKLVREKKVSDLRHSGFPAVKKRTSGGYTRGAQPWYIESKNEVFRIFPALPFGVPVLPCHRCDGSQNAP
jgi:hypothetical protein